MKKLCEFFPDPETLEAVFPGYGNADEVGLLDVIEDDLGVSLIGLKVQCPKCGHVWGIKLEDYDAHADIPDRKFECQFCLMSEEENDDENTDVHQHTELGADGAADKRPE